LSLFQDIELTQQDKKILSLVDGTRTIKQVVDSSWMGSFEALKVLYVLWAIGMIEEANRGQDTSSLANDKAREEGTVSLSDILTPYTAEEEILIKKVDDIFARLDSMTAMDLLEVNDTSDNETIKKSYYRLAKEFHPDRYFSSDDNSIKIKLTSIFDALTKAYTALKDEKSRAEYAASHSAPKQQETGDSETRAAEQYRQGIVEFKKGNFWGAIERFKWAAKLAPKNAAYLSYLSLAYSKLPGRVKEAEEALLAALKIEPFNAEFHSHLGLVYMKAGIKKRAHTSFQKALKIDPENEKARKGLEQTQ
ncbi:MAG TPA: J domain-containing protein, partial [Thermodesulfovibrionales bacterium]|nr:J domain-containing protein [Thermodesulfovibrionales bacterium]